jgi:hypothetical protein
VEPVLPKAPQAQARQVPQPDSQSKPASPAPSTAARQRMTVNMGPGGLSASLADVLPPLPKLDAAGQAMRRGITIGSDAADTLMKRLEMAHPDIMVHPENHASVMDSIKQHLGLEAYKFGTTTPSVLGSNDIPQFTAGLDAVLVGALNGNRMSRERYNDIKQSLPLPGLSDGANYIRLRNVMAMLKSELHGLAVSDTPFDPNNPDAGTVFAGGQ